MSPNIDSSRARYAITYWLLKAQTVQVMDAEEASQQVRETRSRSLTSLPAEILFDIANRLPAAELLCFKATCRYLWFSEEMENILMERESMAGRYGFMQRLKKDLFTRSAENEIADGLKSQANLACSVCQVVHPKDCFDEKAHAANPYTRRCLGSAGEIHICEHDKMSFQQVKEKVREMYRGESQIRGGCFQYLDFPLSPCVVLQPMLLDDPTGRSKCEYLLREMFLVSSTPNYIEVGTHQIRKRLFRLDEYICPHLRTSSESVLQQLASSPIKPLSPKFSVGRECCDLCFLEKKKKNLGSCKAPHCKSVFQISRWPGRGEISLYVSRNLGSLNDATDPPWLAQLDH
ncbi:hypothetical protein BDV96DRAFT_670489 [Lophiotrema nucula]|uniref:F-box domain-containing protein n=1 Tax=Lophiotrema nucula TaxID=690887 RepID=A0A6A5YP67_9PLEO|nr:hypothetical protein BDV96DRAFT_670489 [Lophiotrema nucula]